MAYTLEYIGEKGCAIKNAYNAMRTDLINRSTFYSPGQNNTIKYLELLPHSYFEKTGNNQDFATFIASDIRLPSLYNGLIDLDKDNITCFGWMRVENFPNGTYEIEGHSVPISIRPQEQVIEYYDDVDDDANLLVLNEIKTQLEQAHPGLNFQFKQVKGIMIWKKVDPDKDGFCTVRALHALRARFVTGSWPRNSLKSDLQSVFDDYMRANP